MCYGTDHSLREVKYFTLQMAGDTTGLDYNLHNRKRNVSGFVLPF